MTVHGLAVMQCLATSHAIALRAKQLSFKRWFLLLLIATSVSSIHSIAAAYFANPAQFLRF